MKFAKLVDKAWEEKSAKWKYASRAAALVALADLDK